MLSVTGKDWLIEEAADNVAGLIMQRCGLSDILARLLAVRGLECDDVPQFLEPRLRDLLPNPSGFKDMDIASARIIEAIENGEKIAIFGDYDVDGATSSALFIRFLTAIGCPPRLYIPDRIDEGYGPNIGAMDILAAEGVKLVIMVDCGVTAFEPLSHAKAIGLDVIVFDHHTAEPELPEAVAVVNPNRLDETGEYGHLAAVGVSFLALIALNRDLREKGFYEEKGVSAPNLMAWLDIVALGTVCDVVALKGVNRAFVRQGLKVMAGYHNEGIRALAACGRIDEEPKAFHAGFILGPRINAGGRVGYASSGAKLLSTDSRDEAAAIAVRLDEFNSERKAIEENVQFEAMEQLEGLSYNNADAILMVKGVNWHSGVVGIVASRIKEKFNRPVFVCAIDEEKGEVKASGRSIKGVDIGAAIIAARQSGLLVNGGGHAMAGGFTAELEKMDDLKEFFLEYVGNGLDENLLVPRLRIDAVIAPKAVTIELLDEIEKLAPFGSGNPEPRFMLQQAQIVMPKRVGADKSHISCNISDIAGRGRIKAIAFRAMETELGELLMSHDARAKDLVVTIKRDFWQGVEKAQVHILDARICG